MRKEPSVYFRDLLYSKNKESLKEALHILWFSDSTDYRLKTSPYAYGIRKIFKIWCEEHIDDIFTNKEKCKYCLLYDECKQREYPERYESCTKPSVVNISELILKVASELDITLF